MWEDFDCPICGGKKSLKERFWVDRHGNVKVYWECEKCGAESDSFDENWTFLKITEMLLSVRLRKDD